MPYTKTQRKLEAAIQKKEREEEDQVAQKRNEEERKADERRKYPEEAKENKRQEIEEAMKKSKEEEWYSKYSYRNIVSLQIDRPDKGINDLNEIIPREDMDITGSLGAEQKDAEIQSPQRKKKKKNKRRDKKDKKTRRQK